MKKKFGVLVCVLLTYATSRAAEGSGENVVDTMARTVVEPRDSAVHRLDDMTVRSNRKRTPVLTTSGKVSEFEITAKDVQYLPSTGQADISRAIQLLPGITAANENSAELTIRGSSAEENLIMFDEFTLYYVDHFFGFYTPFNIDAIEKVKVIKGVAPAPYGSRTSGVLDFTGKVAGVDRFHIGGQVGLLSSSLYTGIPIAKRASLFVAGRYSYADILGTPLYRKIFNVFDEERKLQEDFSALDIVRTPKYHYYDLNGKLRITLYSRDTVEVSGYHGKDDLSTHTVASTPQSTEVDNGGNLITTTDWGNVAGSISWKRAWSNRFHSQWAAGYSNYFSKQNEFLDAYYVIIDTATNDTTFNGYAWRNKDSDNSVSEFFSRIHTGVQLSASNRLSIGAELRYLNTTYDQTRAETVQSIQTDTTLTLSERAYVDSKMDKSRSLTSAYIQDEWTLFDRLSLVLGLRTGYYSGLAKFYLDPRASFRAFITDQLSLKGAAGIYHQYINRAERLEFGIEGDRYFWILSSESGSPQRMGKQVVGGVAYNHRFFLVDIEAYYKYLDGVTIYKPSYATSINSFQKGESVTKGVELMVQKKTGIYTGWISYTLSSTIHKFDKINSGKPFYSPIDRPHQFNVVNTLTLKNFILSATFIAATGKPYSKPMGKYIITVNGVDLVFNQSSYMNAYRLPTYHRLDLALTYKKRVRNKWDLAVGTSVFNVYNNKNVTDIEYRFMRDSGGEPTANVIYNFATKSLGVTPTLFVSVNY